MLHSSVEERRVHKSGHILSISRTKTDDPEREKLKAKAKEIQRDEAERIRWHSHTFLSFISNSHSYLQTRRGQQNRSRSNWRSKEKKVRRSGFSDGSTTDSSEVEDQTSSPPRCDVPDGAGETFETLRPPVPVLLQLVVILQDNSLVIRKIIKSYHFIINS